MSVLTPSRTSHKPEQSPLTRPCREPAAGSSRALPRVDNSVDVWATGATRSQAAGSPISYSGVVGQASLDLVFCCSSAT